MSSHVGAVGIMKIVYLVPKLRLGTRYTIGCADDRRRIIRVTTRTMRFRTSAYPISAPYRVIIALMYEVVQVNSNTQKYLFLLGFVS